MSMANVAAEYRTERLSNGLRIIGSENRALHSFVCGAIVRSGPRFESPEQIGLTHLLEHMLMQGSERFPSSGALMREVEDVGGVIDAATHVEYMSASVGMHRKHWRKSVDILGDVLLRPLFDPGEIEVEKRIIAQEIGEYRDQHGRNISALELAYCLLFKEHLDEAGIGGSPQIMAGFDRQMVEAHYRRFFTPRNMVLCVAGSFDFDEVMEALGEHFSGMEQTHEVPPLLSSQVRSRRARSVYRITERAPVVDVLVSYHSYALGDEKMHAANAAAEALGGGMSSRLFSRVREEQGLVYEINTLPQLFSDSGFLTVALKVGADNLVEAFASSLEVVAGMASEGVSEEELMRYKQSSICAIEVMCDRPNHIAEWIGKQELLLPAGKVLSPGQYVRKQEALTLEEVQQVIEEVFASGGGNLAVVGPFDEEQKSRLAALFPAEEIAGSPGGAG